MLPPTVRILVCTAPQDMRKSFDALAAVAQQLLGESPQSGSLYIFVGKRPTRVKALWYDRNGYCLLYKRLHRAFFRIPEAAQNEPAVEWNGTEKRRTQDGRKMRSHRRRRKIERLLA